MVLNAGFWEIICFVLFVLLVYRPIKNATGSSLMAYSGAIRSKIGDATALREEAERFLEQYKAEHKKFSAKSKQILKNTEENIKLLTKEAAAKLAEQITTKQRMHQEKIALQHKEKILQMKLQAIESAVVATKAYLRDNATKSLLSEEIDSSLQLYTSSFAN